MSRYSKIPAVLDPDFDDADADGFDDEADRALVEEA